MDYSWIPNAISLMRIFLIAPIIFLFVSGEFGWALGLAFQLNDDLLGIWGDEAITGKETSRMRDFSQGRLRQQVSFIQYQPAFALGKLI
mgnify:CR=1 FL=1